ncbi:MAG: hypothetical protein LRY24_00590 [Erysipelotrichaceae bacterium]|nr:hypothetical protein [Erysipelotrichaceae bacterium]
MLWDCDQDTLLCLAQPSGPTCHTGKISCFDDEVKEFKSTSVWTHLFDTIKDVKLILKKEHIRRICSQKV